MKSPHIAIIGTGNMGKSLIAGLIKNNHPAHCLTASNRGEEKLIDVQKLFHIHTTTNNVEAAKNADVVIFAVKPHIVPQISKELASIVHTRKPLIISVAAGIEIKNLSQWLNGYHHIVRTMPNLPASIGSGMTTLYADPTVNQQNRNLAESILRVVGTIVWLYDESLMHVATALSGCGPAYFFLVMEALQDAATHFGLPQDAAYLLTVHTALGASKMAIESGETLSTLTQNVASPGGTTEKALSVLEQEHIRELFKK